MGRILAVLALGVLVSCGGGGNRADTPTRFASAEGPIKAACLRSGRTAANRQVCGCIQLAADQTLSGADQRRGASFFGNPERAHAVRLSDTPRDDAFWDRWMTFGQAARQICE
jgi:hypothetical protein